MYIRMVKSTLTCVLHLDCCYSLAKTNGVKEMKENIKNLEVCYVNSPIPACCVYALGYRLT